MEGRHCDLVTPLEDKVDVLSMFLLGSVPTVSLVWIPGAEFLPDSSLGPSASVLAVVCRERA